jgi:hypothetical protein
MSAIGPPWLDHTRLVFRSNEARRQRTVDSQCQIVDFAFCVNVNLFRQIAGRHRFGNFRNGSNLDGQVLGEAIDVKGKGLPSPFYVFDDGLTSETTFERVEGVRSL